MGYKLVSCSIHLQQGMEVALALVFVFSQKLPKQIDGMVSSVSRNLYVVALVTLKVVSNTRFIELMQMR